MLETIYKTKQKRGYVDQSFLIEDTSATSPNYFNLLEVPTILTAGKNVIKMGVDGAFLKRDCEIDLEVLDVNGAPLYNEYTGFRDRYGYHYFIIYVYDLVPQGIGSITFAGVASIDLDGYNVASGASEHENWFNVKWTTYVDIKSTNRNITDIVFQKAPDVSITQVLTPYKFNFGTYTINNRLTSKTLDNLTIYTSDNAGYDYAQTIGSDIEDLLSINNSYNYFLKSSTANTVQTNVRKYNKDIVNGFTYSEYARYNTVVYDSQGRLTKDMEGSVFSFANLDSGVSMINSWNYQPPLSSSYIQILGSSGSIPGQLAAYQPKIVTVYNNRYALLSKAPTIKVIDSQNTMTPITKDYTIKQINYATGSFLYPTSSTQEVQSANLSSSYIQFTFLGLNPVAGDVYRIKTYAKEAGKNTEYYQLNDHITSSPEFLIDSDKQNQAVYAKNKSDFFTYGEFTDVNVAVDYWRGFVVSNNNINQFSFNLSSSAILDSTYLANGLILSSSAAAQRGATTRYYQAYIPDEPYTLSFYCTLDAGCELELYMSSTPLKDTVLGLQAPRAFNQSRDAVDYSKLGKLIGRVSNISGSGRQVYDNVVFDFFPDADGFGRPVFYLKNSSTTSKNAYISSISVAPLDLVGFTPSILQFAASAPDSINILQDDDASLTQSIDVKIEYFTADGKQSEYSTYIPNLQINMINEVPGFCTSEASKFNDHCPFYYEVSTSSSIKQTSGIVTTDPTLYSSKYFWPTYSLNGAGDYYWNIRSFAITGSTYKTLQWVKPISSSITSSWQRHDVMLPLYTASLNIPGGASLPHMYSASSTPVTFSAAVIDGSMTSYASTDRRFYQANGAAIDKYELAYSQSALLQYSNSFDIQSNTTRLRNLETYLKKSRLYFPATSSNYLYGFYENGGIYNVRFKISKVPSLRYEPDRYIYPDNGQSISAATQVGTYNRTSDYTKYQPDTGSKLMVYIADVGTPVTNSILIPGREGFFPPANNVVTIGNGYSTTPTIAFYDSGSGYNVESYDILLVQYGEKAQLVFDACGLEYQLDSNGYYKITNNVNQAFWGGVISDIEWCKIGVTTDDRFIKPANFSDVFSTFISYTSPPPAPPIQDQTVSN